MSLGFLNQDSQELCLIREFKPRSKRRYHLIKSEVLVVYISLSAPTCRFFLTSFPKSVLMSKSKGVPILGSSQFSYFHFLASYLNIIICIHYFMG